MLTYSVAIRTLGTSLETLRRELNSLHNQTVPPERICIYIAEGYPTPDFRIGIEEYFIVKKGMVSQRALPYNEIKSECILMLDDDVELEPNSAEKLLYQMEEADADCIAVDNFKNHEMSFHAKLRAFFTGFVFPRFNQKWGIKLHSNGSFSYINSPQKDYYPSMSGSGPASLWKKRSFLCMNYEAETWLDNLSFAYGEDDITFYKLFINGGKLFVSFNNGIVNLDGQGSSANYKKDPKRLYTRAYSNYARWYRMHFFPKKGMKRFSSNLNFGFKIFWLGLIHFILCLKSFSFKPLKYFISGNIDGKRFVKSDNYKVIPPYVLK